MAETPYEHQQIEKKWQEKWFSSNLFRAADDDKREKYYVLDMFPYPSGAGLHVGHPEGYTATDIISRYMRMKGYNVLHPMGWDAFGLPAENYAIKTQVHPEKSTLDNITTFKRQIQELGFSYDWDRELATCLPDYYKWTQWWFSFLYKNGLAYKKEAAVNWCNSCNTVLANEQVINGNCDRCKNEVVQKNLAQWFFKITDFIEDNGKTSGLLSGLEKIDWPESTKVGQSNWIGKSKGLIFTAPVKDTDLTVQTFSAHFEACYADTFVVIAPDHPFLETLLEGVDNKQEILDFCDDILEKRIARGREEEKEPEGIFTGRYIEDPLGNGDLPIWVASFALANYGTGIVKCSCHDERDFAFAKKYNIPLKPVLMPDDPELRKQVEKLEVCFTDMQHGTLLEPAEFKGQNASESREGIIQHCEANGFAVQQTNYKLRDWLVSRQRYWGAPIPMVFDDEGNEYLIPEDELPVELPKDVDFNPTGESPLHHSKSFHNPEDLKRIEDKLKATGDMPADRTIIRRESDTMDTFVCSSWYMWRFMDPKNDQEMANKKLINQWGPVDLYVGGAEHTVLHLLYARFFCKVLHKHGLVDYDEPFTKLRHQGMILGEDGEKMSKSRGNVINPDEIIQKYGADTLRLYEMFMGPFKDMKPWSMKGVLGVYRFLQKVWRLGTESTLTDDQPDEATLKLSHQTLKKVTHDIEDFKFNTAVSQMMVLTNHLQKLEGLPVSVYETLLICLSPFAPHMAEELWEMSGHKEMIMDLQWPAYDDSLTQEDSIKLPIQINGKLRASIEVPADISQEEALKLAKAEENVAKHIDGKELVKEIFVPGKIINLVVKG